MENNVRVLRIRRDGNDCTHWGVMEVGEGIG